MRVTTTLIPMGLGVLLAGCLGSDAPDSVEPAAAEVRASGAASKQQTTAQPATKSASLPTVDDGFGGDDAALATRVSKFNLLPLPASWQGSLEADDGDPRVVRQEIFARFDPESFRNTKELRLWMGGTP